MNGLDTGYKIMRRYWIEKKNISDQIVSFSEETFHHIFDVCRQGVGSHFEVLVEDGWAHLVEVTQIQKKTATAKIIKSRIIPLLPHPHIHLALSLSRFPVMDAIIEKSVEMGVKSIQPFFSDHSFLHKGDKLSDNKIERWNKIIKSATQQCGRGDLMTLFPIITIEELSGKMNRNKNSVGLFAYEGKATLSIKESLQKTRLFRQNLEEIWVIVGSEGGFSNKEVLFFEKLGLDPVTLGNQVLRVETACIALISVLKYEFDLMYSTKEGGE